MGKNTSTLYTVRTTNEADTKFGPVEQYPTPFFTVYTFAISGGPLGRLDAVAAGDNNSLKPVYLATQSLTPWRSRREAGRSPTRPRTM